MKATLTKNLGNREELA